jgi:hypothetical protein
VYLQRRTRRLANVYADFLSHIAALKRVAKWPAPLSVEQHAAHRKKMEDVIYIKPKYVLETQINISVIQRKWQRSVATLIAPPRPL